MERIWEQIRLASVERNSHRGQPINDAVAVDDSTAEPQSTEPRNAEQKRNHAILQRIKNLPTAVGVVLVGAGIAGIILPGPLGTPLIIAGGLVLAPRSFGKLTQLIETRYPELHRIGLDAVDRFLVDLDRRYPLPIVRHPEDESQSTEAEEVEAE